MAVIKKEEKAIVAFTSKYKIRGNIFVPPGGRLSDFLGALGQKKFIPVTEAVVTDISGNLICKANFLELNKDEVVFIFPESESGK